MKELKVEIEILKSEVCELRKVSNENFKDMIVLNERLNRLESKRND